MEPLLSLEVSMPFVIPEARSLQGHPLVGKGECVELIKQMVPGLIGHSTEDWRPGAHVLDTENLPVGTAIATFVNGRFPRRNTGQHAALFLGYAGKAALWVMDQWAHDENRRKVWARVIHHGRPGDTQSNSAEAFYVIELK
jgi:hypothetical protein